MSRVDVLAIMARDAADASNARHGDLEIQELLGSESQTARRNVAAVFDAARAVLSASDFTDLLHAEECLREALADCEPETPHEPV